MALSNAKNSEELARGELGLETYLKSSHLNGTAVSWSSILAGAAAAAALALILLLLGAGLGLSSVSPWAHKGVSASAFGISTIVWLTVTQILASGMGGYLAGRLRTIWGGVHIDEVYFRDTAHGFLVWAVASLATAALLTSAIGGIVNSGAQVAATLAGGAVTAAAATGAATSENDKFGNNLSNSTTNGLGYFIDSLFRTDANIKSAQGNVPPTDSPQQAIPTLEVTRIFINALDAKALPPADVTYIAQLISNKRGLSQQEAEKRVNDVYTRIQKKKADAEMAAKNAAEKARKASIYATLWLFVSLLMGAFSASLAATWGGRGRDADFIYQPNSI